MADGFGGADSVAEVAKQFEADMREFADAATEPENVKDALRAGAEVLVENSKRNVRAQGLVGETETLAEDWEIRDFSDRKRHAHLRAGPVQDAFYGLFHEIGAAHNTAKPFLRPAFDENIDEIAEAIRSELEEVTE